PAENFTGALRAGLRYVQYSPAIYGVLVRTFAFSFGASAHMALAPNENANVRASTP
ncbi:MAG: hypothetical protein EOO59_06285, partial [Hymenobacter sp.]